MSTTVQPGRVGNEGAVVGARTGPQKLWGMSRQRLLVVGGLGLIILLGAFLRLYQLGAHSIGNAYYAATVRSMLTSWHNFFFAAYEPGGSVTVDKPPLGFWAQAVSAYFLGVNGFALALPQALAGVLSIPLLYKLVKRPFGAGAGLVAALALAVTPVTVATERNNTIDGLLLFVLLLAAWAFVRAVETGRLRALLLGAVLVGLGFNIKMLQAFMPLPAFYALYLLGAPHRWWKRLLHLALATGVLLVVSLSWAVAVDLTPADSRPYIGSSENNTVLELVVGHNGLRRLGLDRLLASDGRDAARQPFAADAGLGQLPDDAPGPSGAIGQRPPMPGGPPSPPDSAGQRPPSPDGPPPFGSATGGRPADQGPGNPPAGGGGFSHEVGEVGLGRLFGEPLVTQASWLLPLALLGLPLALVVAGRRRPLSEKHLALLLWGVWLLVELVYFSLTTGLFHAYYLIMLGPPLAALVGTTAWALGQVWERRRWLGWMAVLLLTGATLAFQSLALQDYPAYAGWVTAVAGGLWLAGVGLLAARRSGRLNGAAWILIYLGIVAAPLTWSALTTLNASPEVALPHAGPDTGQLTGSDTSTLLSPTQEKVLDYLLDNTAPDSYLVAGLSSHDVSGYILATGRPALTFGGFNGGDDVVDVEQLAQMVSDGELRFVLGGGQLGQRKPEIGVWLDDHCEVVTVPGASGQMIDRGGPGESTLLYDCASFDN